MDVLTKCPGHTLSRDLLTTPISLSAIKHCQKTYPSDQEILVSGQQTDQKKGNLQAFIQLGKRLIRQLKTFYEVIKNLQMEAITDDDYDDHEYDHENADELKVKTLPL